MSYTLDKTRDLMIHMELTPIELFQKEAPEAAEAFNGLIQALIASKGLDQKTKQLMYIAMKTAMGDDHAVRAHLPMAKALGATREEMIDTVLLTLTVNGISGVLQVLPMIVEMYDKQ